MKNEYAKYKDYKKSDVHFIDYIPIHWNTWKVTHGYRTIGSGTTPKSDNPEYYNGEIPWITTSELREGLITDTNQRISELALKKISSLKKYKPGAIAIAMYGATIGRLGILGIESTVNQACCVYDDPEKFYPKFLFYWLWMSRNTLIAFSAGGGQPNLSQDDLKQLKIPIPEIPEQIQIARFLDQKTGQIDRLIEQKEKLLKLLAEKRTAIITRAVTKGLPAEERAKAGLDPNVEMKDSGIDWLGEIPKHWIPKRLKFCLTEPLKYGANEAAESSDSDQPRFVRITDVDENGNLREETFRSINIDIAKPFLLEEGDLLMARSGATVGKNFMYKSNWGVACFAGYLIRARINKEIILPEFASLFFNSDSYWSWINSIFIQSTIQNISAEKYANLILPIPPKEEQQQIVAYAMRKREKLGNVIDGIKDSLLKLKEYREALITSAVTGQIDVRKEVIHG